MGDTQCQMDMKTLKHQKSEFTMTVGKHKASVSYYISLLVFDQNINKRKTKTSNF